MKIIIDTKTQSVEFIDDAVAGELESLKERSLDVALPYIAGIEGFRANAYRDAAGVWTIGYGHTSGVRPNDTISKERADELLRDETTERMDFVLRAVDVPLTANQLAALTSFAYNVGLGAFGNSTLLQLLNKGDYEGAANEFGRWKYAGGRVLNGLVRRRAEEKEIFQRA